METDDIDDNQSDTGTEIYDTALDGPIKRQFMAKFIEDFAAIFPGIMHMIAEYADFVRTNYVFGLHHTR